MSTPRNQKLTAMIEQFKSIQTTASEFDILEFWYANPTLQNWFSAEKSRGRPPTRQKEIVAEAEDLLFLFRGALTRSYTKLIPVFWESSTRLHKIYYDSTLKRSNSGFALPFTDCVEDYLKLSKMRLNAITLDIWRSNTHLAKFFWR